MSVVVFSSLLLLFASVVESASSSIDVFLPSSMVNLEVPYALEFSNEGMSLAISAPVAAQEGLRRGGGGIVSSSTSYIGVYASASLSMESLMVSSSIISFSTLSSLYCESSSFVLSLLTIIFSSE